MSSRANVPWAPPRDDDLTWFRVRGTLPSRPGPLEYSFGVYAFTYGLGHALDSLNFPLHDLRSRVIDGQLYLAAAPSALAEGDLERRMQRMRDATLRFSRNIRAPWERAIKAEVEECTERIAVFPPSGATGPEVAAGLFTLKRVRANQWFAPFRAVIAPTALLQAGIGETPTDEALAVVEEVRELVVVRGTSAFDGALGRVAESLMGQGSIAAADDMAWLDYAEVCGALTQGHRYQPTVAKRRAASNGSALDGPATVGPPLPSDAPRMYLLRETLNLIGVDS